MITRAGRILMLREAVANLRLAGDYVAASDLERQADMEEVRDDGRTSEPEAGPQALADILSTYAFKLGTGEIWGVPSRSQPDQIRIVVFFENGTVVCSCPARLRCRHVGLAEDHRRRMHKPSRESAEQLFGDKLTQRVEQREDR